MTESLNLCSTRITKNLTRRNKFESNPTQRDYGLAPSKSRSEGEVPVRTVIRRRERRAVRAVAVPPYMPRPVPAPHREGGEEEEDPVPNPDDSPEFPNRHKNQASPMAGNRGNPPPKNYVAMRGRESSAPPDRGGVPPPVPATVPETG